MDKCNTERCILICFLSQMFVIVMISLLLCYCYDSIAW